MSIKLPNGRSFKLIAKNNSKDNVYIQSASLNGKPLDKPWFTHRELAEGGTIELLMGDIPNRKWGAAVESTPPSYMDLNTSANY